MRVLALGFMVVAACDGTSQEPRRYPGPCTATREAWRCEISYDEADRRSGVVCQAASTAPDPDYRIELAWTYRDDALVTLTATSRSFDGG